MDSLNSIQNISDLIKKASKANKEDILEIGMSQLSNSNEKDIINKNISKKDEERLSKESLKFSDPLSQKKFKNTGLGAYFDLSV